MNKEQLQAIKAENERVLPKLGSSILALIEEVERLQRENAYLTRKNLEDSGLIPLLRNKIIALRGNLIALEGNLAAYEKATDKHCIFCLKWCDCGDATNLFDKDSYQCKTYEFDFVKFMVQ